MAARVTSALKVGKTYSILQTSGQKMRVPVWAGWRQYSPETDHTAGGAAAEEKPKEPKKSRTGGDMADDGQVMTPGLDKTRSTLDYFDTKKKETEDRQAAEKEKV